MPGRERVHDQLIEVDMAVCTVQLIKAIHAVHGQHHWVA